MNSLDLLKKFANGKRLLVRENADRDFQQPWNTRPAFFASIPAHQEMLVITPIWIDPRANFFGLVILIAIRSGTF